MFGKIIIGVAVAAVAIVLFVGISTMFVEGQKARTWSNRLMRLRVLAQFIAILIVLAVFYFSRS